MAELRTVRIDYEGMGDRHFNRQQRVMEHLRDTIPTIEYDPTQIGPNGQGSIFGEGATYYNNGNDIRYFVDQDALAQSHLITRTSALGPSEFDLYGDDDTYKGVRVANPVDYTTAFNYPINVGKPAVSRDTAAYKPNDLLLVSDSRTKAHNPF